MKRELWLALAIAGMWTFAVFARSPGCPPEYVMEPLGIAVSLGVVVLAGWIILEHAVDAVLNFRDRWLSP